jgi:large repetitive protein
MLLRIFSRWNNSSAANRSSGRRTLRLERLEDRQLLSIGAGAPYAVASGAANSGPTIGMVSVSVAQNTVSWNAADADGVKSSSLTVDGVAAAKLFGPYKFAPGVNYAGVYGGLLTGTHTYAITATDSLGNASQYTGTLNATGPTISKVSVSLTQRTITWNAADALGVKSSSLMIDGKPVAKLYGPYTAPPGVNYAGWYGSIGNGNHTYVITATDSLGNSSKYTGTFSVVPPTISSVVVNVVKGVITWNVVDSLGIYSSKLTVDGVTVPTVYGPFPGPTGQNYSGAYGVVSSGNHSFIISATDNAGNTSLYTGTLNTGAPDVGPVISRVTVNLTQNLITWNAASGLGVASSSISVDGMVVSNISGPYQSAPGVNYAGSYGSLANGSHTYIITATDGAGVSSQTHGTFAVGPTISSVALNLTKGLITWNVAAAAGVASSSLTLDGTAVTNVFGPVVAPPGVNFSGVLGSLVGGSHTYLISATDKAGNSTQYTGSFNVGATIGSVVVNVAQRLITWNAVASDGVASSSLLIDGTISGSVQGPFPATSGVNFNSTFGALGIGDHSYVITVLDNTGISTQYSGTFTLTS